MIPVIMMLDRMLNFIIVGFFQLMNALQRLEKTDCKIIACLSVLFLSADDDAPEAVCLPGSGVILGK